MLNQPWYRPAEKRLYHELMLKVPEMHEMAAMALTIHMMVGRDEISSQEYLELSAALGSMRGRPLFSPD